MTSMSKDQVNYVKCSCVSVDLFPEVLRHVIQVDIPPSQIWIKTQAALSRGFKLGREQQQKVKNAVIVGYSEFDVTLCYSLIRNLALSSVTSPSKGWGKIPSLPSHLTTGDDIERKRDLRNTVYGHASSTGISDPDFRGYWKTIQDICSRIDTKYGVNTFTDKLKDIEKVDFVPKVVANYIDLVNKQLQKDDALQKELENLKGKRKILCIQIACTKTIDIHVLSIHTSVSTICSNMPRI